MPKASKQTIATDFLAAAHKVVAENLAFERQQARLEKERLAAEETARRQREHAQSLATRRANEAQKTAEAKLAVEVSPLLRALEALPPKNGKTFCILREDAYGYSNGTYKVEATVTYGNNYNACNPKYLTVNSVYKNGQKTDEKFAQVRADLGQWVAEVAGDRVAELRKMMAPKKPQAKTLSR